MTAEMNVNKSVNKNLNKILSIGAEAVVSLVDIQKEELRVLKKRIAKRYRIKDIDNKLRSFRTRREAKVLGKLNSLGFTPKLFFSDNQSTLEIEYIDGRKLSDAFEKEDVASVGSEIGRKVKQIHDNGIIHGDLTTSNMLIKNCSNIYFVDFGLSFFSDKEEDKAVDLHLLDQSLQSRHHKIADKAFAAVKQGYNDKLVLKRLKEVEMRGRNKR